MKSREENPLARMNFFLSAVAREILPDRLHKTKTQRVLKQNPPSALTEAMSTRLAYYNKLTKCAARENRPPTIDSLVYKTKPFYIIDFLEYAKGFDPKLRVETLFGDITHVPQHPTVLKSRPIHGDNSNSVIFPLEKFRHFNFPVDPVKFDDKRPFSVWRGRPNNAQRTVLVKKYFDHTGHDIGMVEDHQNPHLNKQWIEFNYEFGFRYILSIEGFDVATNLKRTMASNSVAVSPPLVYETWYMEGRLIPDVHYIGVKPDFSDMDEKLKYFEANQDQLRTIIKNANEWTRQFLDKNTERILATLVLQKYLEMTGELPNAKSRQTYFT